MQSGWHCTCRGASARLDAEHWSRGLPAFLPADLVNLLISASVQVVGLLTKRHGTVDGRGAPTMARDLPCGRAWGWLSWPGSAERSRPPGWKRSTWQRANALAVGMG